MCLDSHKLEPGDSFLNPLIEGEDSVGVVKFMNCNASFDRASKASLLRSRTVMRGKV